MNSKPSLITTSCILLFLGGLFLSLKLGPAQNVDEQIFWMIRLPRALSAITVGGGLCVAGALVQASFSNPLADPYTIGISAAATLGAVIGTVFFKNHAYFGSNFFAFLFAIAGTFFLYRIMLKNFFSNADILLTGVISGFFFTALATLILALSDPANWTSALMWMMGSVSSSTAGQAMSTLIFVFVLTVLSWLHWKPLDAISTGDVSAESIGVDVGLYRKRFFILSALITAFCVSIAGIIGFVGLIVPHLLRRAGVFSHYLLIPLSFLMGSALLLISDSFARSVISPAEIPVGVVLALMGAPAFLYLSRGETK